MSLPPWALRPKSLHTISLGTKSLGPIALCASLNPGCALGTGFLELTNLNFADHTRTRSSPLGELEREVIVTPANLSSWRLTCATRTRHAQERVTDESFTYTPVRRIIIALAGAAEGVLSVYALTRGFGEQPRSPLDLGVGIPAGLDALSSLLFAALAREQHAIRDMDHDGPWSSESACPANLAIEREDRRYPVSPSGELSPEDFRELSTSLVEHGGPARLSVGRASEDIIPTVAARCAWATALAHPAAQSLCPSVPAYTRRSQSSPWTFTVQLRTY